MATPPTAAAFIAALREEGLTVVEVGRWWDHNRNHKGPWGPVNGVMIHHTVTKGTDNTVRICRDGYSALPGPLCHGVIAKSGTVYVVGYGRTNHAGGRRRTRRSLRPACRGRRRPRGSSGRSRPRRPCHSWR